MSTGVPTASTFSDERRTESGEITGFFCTSPAFLDWHESCFSDG